MLVINGRSHIWYFCDVGVIHVYDECVIAVVSAVLGVIVGNYINVSDKRVMCM